MKITFTDWLVVAVYFLVNLSIGLYYRKRASASTDEFFVSGREVSWWLAGTSMVATTFAADTPLWVTGQVAQHGIAANWLWWSFLFSGMMTVFFFARLWRRAEIITDVELIELRYGGKPAAFLRGFRALYFGVLMNCLIVGWVNLAMEKILGTALGVSRPQAIALIFGIIALTSFYTFISGLWGVLWTDLIQFALKMTMVIVLAYYGVRAVGGMQALKAKLALLDASRAAAQGGTGSILSFVPDLNSPWMPLATFSVYIGVNWWANWYPGAEPGGGGYVAQRIFCAKDEKNSLWATLWFNIAHYAVRPWPWILTALASLVLYPTLADKESGYVRTLMDPSVFPPSLRGIMLAAFAAAYMSTIGTQLNWGASYVVNDVYRRFVRRDAAEREYVVVSQAATVGLMLVSIYVTLHLASIEQAWKLLIVTGAGTGTVLLLRWFWWRINAWSEVSAMAVAAAVSLSLQLALKWDSDRPRDFAYIMIVTVSVTTIAWLIVTWLTPPESESTLTAFYPRVRPQGPGWAPIARAAGMPPAGAASLARQIVNAALGCVLVYSALFGVGELLLRSALVGLALLALSALTAFAIARNLQTEETLQP